MKVRELKNFLELKAGEAEAGAALKGFSHWVSAIFQAKEYVTSNPKDETSLKQLESLGIVELTREKGQLVAVLSPSGRELYKDFYAHGYFI